MKKHNHLQTRFKYAICAGLLASGLGSLITARADTTDDKKSDAKAEQTRQEAEAKRKAEEARIKPLFPYTFNAIADKIVIIKSINFDGDRYAGSGFIGKMDGQTYLFTNQHMIMGSSEIAFTTTTGEELHPRGVELSVTRDIARLPLPDHDGFVIDSPTVEMPIAIFGNSEGGGVATALYGKAKSVTSDLIEVSADFVAGNSGSPVLNTNKAVVGIVSYVRFSAADDTSKDGKHEKKARRFCYRLSDLQWMPVNWKKYNAEYGKEYLETEALVDSIFDVVSGWGDQPYGYVSQDYRDYDLKKWAKAHNDMVNKIRRLADKGVATQKELDNTNKQISHGISNSAESLAKICKQKSKIVEMKLQQKDLTGFLRDKFKGYVTSLNRDSVLIETFGNELAQKNYFYFK